MTAGLILAAGASRRMRTPKALLDFRGETFVDRLIGLFAARANPVIVVLGGHAAEIRAAARRPANFVLNPDYESGMLGSLQCGLRAVPPDASGVLFTLVDHPAVAGSTVDALLSPAGAALFRVPRYRAKRGHPVWFQPSLIAEFLAPPAGATARDIVAAHAAETDYLDLDDPGIVADIDDPAAYRELMGASL
ncbi:MAG: NTP transferase domain-containing protein [Bryobacteraceae bacterium]